jgi:DNA-binding transcriptional MerR regulator
VKLVRLEELAHWGQQIMDKLGWQEGDSKRVNWAPNPRLIRYYTTLGLLDRATRFQGRVALYSSKHLLQILAIKYLQLGGKKLEEIQQVLLGLNEESLAKMLGLELPLPEPQLEVPADLAREESPPYQAEEQPTRSQAFWQEMPSRPLHQSSPEHREQLPARVLTSYEPLSGIQVLIDPERLPEGFSLEEFLHRLEVLTRSCRL